MCLSCTEHAGNKYMMDDAAVCKRCLERIVRLQRTKICERTVIQYCNNVCVNQAYVLLVSSTLVYWYIHAYKLYMMSTYMSA